MDFRTAVHPEILEAMDKTPDELMALIAENPVAVRSMLAEMQEQRPPIGGGLPVEASETHCPGPAGEIPLYVYQPATSAPRPAMLWIHGGGYLVGHGKDEWAIPFSHHAGCTVVSVDYRLAPEHPFPAGPEDCYAALLWMIDNAASLGIDPARIAIGGASAGGGMAAGVALMNRDRGGPELAFQLLLYPMIDDTHDTPSGHWVRYPKVWNREVSLKAWAMYLGDKHQGDVSPYAAATRAKDLGKLPPAFICVGSADLFRDENIDYAKRLLAAGVPTELAVYAGLSHGAEYAAPEVEVCKRIRSDYYSALARAFSRT